MRRTALRELSSTGDCDKKCYTEHTGVNKSVMKKHVHAINRLAAKGDGHKPCKKMNTGIIFSATPACLPQDHPSIPFSRKAMSDAVLPSVDHGYVVRFREHLIAVHESITESVFSFHAQRIRAALQFAELQVKDGQDSRKRPVIWVPDTKGMRERTFSLMDDAIPEGVEQRHASCVRYFDNGSDIVMRNSTLASAWQLLETRTTDAIMRVGVFSALVTPLNECLSQLGVHGYMEVIQGEREPVTAIRFRRADV